MSLDMILTKCNLCHPTLLYQAGSKTLFVKRGLKNSVYFIGTFFRSTVAHW